MRKFVTSYVEGEFARHRERGSTPPENLFEMYGMLYEQNWPQPLYKILTNGVTRKKILSGYYGHCY